MVVIHYVSLIFHIPIKLLFKEQFKAENNGCSIFHIISSDRDIREIYNSASSQNM